MMNSVSQIIITCRSDIACTSALLTQTPSQRVLVLHLGKINIPRHTVARRGPLTAVVLAAAVALPDDLGLSPFHSEGVSMMRVTTSLNAPVTQMWALIESIPKWGCEHECMCECRALAVGGKGWW